MRQVKIDGGLFQVAMTEQQLDGAQVSAGFQQMSSEAMAQRVWMDVFVSQAGTNGSAMTSQPDDVGRDRVLGCVPAATGKQPLALAPQVAPVLAKSFQQL